jgi:iron complex outermembrane receptor protein
MAGVSYLHSSWHSVENQYWNTPGFPPGSPFEGQLFNGPFTNDFDQDTHSAAMFVNGTWRPTDRMDVFLGLRLTDERKDVVFGRSNFAPFTLWNTEINPPFAPTPLDFDGRFLDGNLAVQFDFSEQATVYASVGRGNKLGGFAETTSVPNGDTARDARIGTETATSWELGARFRMLADRFYARTTLFYMNIADFQDTTFDGTAFVTANLPVRSKGVEIETSWNSGQGFDARLAVTWADATAIIGDRSLQLTQAPRWSGVASIAYSRALTAALRGSAGIDLLYRGEMFNQRGELFPSSSFAPLGLKFGLDDSFGRWGVAIIARNVSNRISADFAGPNPDPWQVPIASPAGLRSVLLSGWFKL